MRDFLSQRPSPRPYSVPVPRGRPAHAQGRFANRLIEAGVVGARRCLALTREIPPGFRITWSNGREGEAPPRPDGLGTQNGADFRGVCDAPKGHVAGAYIALYLSAAVE